MHDVLMGLLGLLFIVWSLFIRWALPILLIWVGFAVLLAPFLLIGHWRGWQWVRDLKEGKEIVPAIKYPFDKKHTFLFNLHPARVTLDGKEYPTVTLAYQAAKALNKANRQGTPSYFDKAQIMENLLAQKFISGPDAPTLGPLLRATGTAELVRGVGKHSLGRLLMKVRTQLNAEGLQALEVKRGSVEHKEAIK